MDNLIIEAINGYKSKLENNNRLLSWNYCYTKFYETRKQDNCDYDILALNLAFYLASWGMYRGSSFLLNKDYKVHIGAVEIILDNEYNDLLGIKCSEVSKYNKELTDLVERLNNYYYSIKTNKDSVGKVSDTLISKILLGTLACTPAYDKYFSIAIKKNTEFSGTFSINSINSLAEFYCKHKDLLDSLLNEFKLDNIEYPEMKLLDMIFWQIGYNTNHE